MKLTMIIILILITVSTSLCQYVESISELRLQYSKGLSRGNIRKHFRGEDIVFKLDSIGGFAINSFTQDSIAWKIKIKKNQAVAINRGLKNILVQERKKSNKIILDWITELGINRELIDSSDIKKSISKDEIIQIAKNSKLYYKLESQELVDIERHFFNIGSYKYISEFIKECKFYQMASKDKKEWEYLNVTCYFQTYAKFYKISFYENYFPSVNSEFDPLLNKFKNITYNYSMDRLTPDFLPQTSFIRKSFNMKSLYVKWYLRNKV